MTLILALGPYA